MGKFLSSAANDKLIRSVTSDSGHGNGHGFGGGFDFKFHFRRW